MPSAKPRMVLTLPESTHAALFELAKAMGKPAATIAAEILVDAAPNLRELARIARHLKVSPAGGVAEMAATLARISDGAKQAELGLLHAISPPPRSSKPVRRTPRKSSK